MNKTLAIIGAGPLTGLATAKRFGRLGFRVALVARRRAALDEMIAELAAEGIEARGFVGDVEDQASLRDALAGIRSAFATVHVLMFAPHQMNFVAPSAVTVELARRAFQLLVAAPITAVQEFLPDMIERGEGALLLVTGRSAIQPMKAMGATSLATCSARAYFYELHDELKSKGIYAGVLTLSVLIDKQHAETISSIVVDMYQKRDRIEDVHGIDVEVIGQISTLTQKSVNDFVWPEDVPSS